MWNREKINSTLGRDKATSTIDYCGLHKVEGQLIFTQDANQFLQNLADVDLFALHRRNAYCDRDNVAPKASVVSRYATGTDLHHGRTSTTINDCIKNPEKYGPEMRARIMAYTYTHESDGDEECDYCHGPVGRCGSRCRDSDLYY